MRCLSISLSCLTLRKPTSPLTVYLYTRHFRLQAVSSYLTPAACAVHCSSVDGATYFGVQSGRKCFCGDSYGKHGVSTKCDKPCTGDGQQVCGAHNVNSVYTLLAPEDFVPLESAQDNESPSCPNGGHCGCFVDSPPKSLLKNLTMKDR